MGCCVIDSNWTSFWLSRSETVAGKAAANCRLRAAQSVGNFLLFETFCTPSEAEYALSTVEVSVGGAWSVRHSTQGKK